MAKIRVLVVDDSAFMRKVISDIISKDNELELIGTARNGKDALTKVIKLNPDVITLDVEMPEMNGLEALEKIMEIKPTPTVMLSSLTQKGAEITIKALAKGAIDFVQKPGGTISLNIFEVEKELITKIKLAYHANLKGVSEDYILETKDRTLPVSTKKIEGRRLSFPLVLIGTSTGGPKALHKIFENFKQPLKAAFLIVQHMPAGFTNSLAQRLDSISAINVIEGKNGEKVQPGFAYIAPGNYQMEVKLDEYSSEPYLNVHQGPLVTGHRPSVDALFNSVAKLGVCNVIAVIMTGMGHDGRDGIKSLKANGSLTIAEAEETCIVYGMPKAAVETGCVDKIVPLHHIHDEIVRSLNFIS
ncbi:MAG: chemotaxis response regulator protein-glutamate methylesterase [Clostridia bacterium]|nr:chemotaxis response regulator protein-glutamate methylesterase [Clostridia bacterium]